MRRFVVALVMLFGCSGLAVVAQDRVLSPEQLDDLLKRCTQRTELNDRVLSLTRHNRVTPVVVNNKTIGLRTNHRRLHNLCDRLKDALKRRPRGPFPPAVNTSFQQAEVLIEQTKRQADDVQADIERLGLQVGATYNAPAPFAWRASLFSDLGGSFSSGDRRFPAFSQTMGRDNDWYGSAGVNVDIPLGSNREASNFWFSVAIMMFYLNTKIQEVRNDAGGSISSTGNDILRGVAFLAGVGGRLWPSDPWLSRWQWQLLGGIGYAHNSLRGVGLAGNEQYSASEHVVPWLVRLALYYSLTDNLKAGFALTLITTPAVTGQLPNGTRFQIDRAINYLAAVSLLYAFSSLPRSGDTYPLR